MTTTTFLILLSAFSIISSVITEGIKKLVQDKANLPYNLVTLVTSMIIGIAGCAIYYRFYTISFTVNNIICMLLMGFASGLSSMVGFDKVKQTIEQLTRKSEGGI